jgi:TldD protein
MRRSTMSYRMSIFVAVLMLRLTCISWAADESPLLSAMDSELKRSMEMLEFDDFDKPYFICYSLNEVERISIQAEYGALTDVERNRDRYLGVNLHVGSYEFDNTPSDPDFFRMPDYYDRFARNNSKAPLEDDIGVVRRKLWLLTDARYKQALDVLNEKRGELISKVEEEDRPDDFSREESTVHIEPLKTLNFDVDEWKQTMKAVSDMFSDYAEILTSRARLRASLRNQLMVNTEGSRMQLSDYYFTITVDADARCDDGMSVYNVETWKASTVGDLPTRAEIMERTQGLIDELLSLRKAEPAEPYTGPAIIVGEASGVFFHEALGHRLEGHRLRNEEEGHTFKGKVGQKVIPEFLSVYDDPTVDEFNGTPLYGHYEFDQEIVPAQRVNLVEDGILQNFLMSRLPAVGFPNSNGHGRADIYSQPVSRMGNLFVTTSEPHSEDELVNMLIEECKTQEKDYGLVFDVLTSGETNTSGFGIQTLKCRPVLVHKVYVDDGHRELVRGVELIGTPLNILENVVAAGDDPEVFNGTCGAESGSIPVSAIAPSILITKIEVQRTRQESKRPPILPPPVVH